MKQEQLTMRCNWCGKYGKDFNEYKAPIIGQGYTLCNKHDGIRYRFFVENYWSPVMWPIGWLGIKTGFLDAPK